MQNPPQPKPPPLEDHLGSVEPALDLAREARARPRPPVDLRGLGLFKRPR